MRKILLVMFLIAGCSESMVFTEYQPIDDRGWDKNHRKEFTFTTTDSLLAHHVYILVRNDDTFPFSNLFLITEMTFPEGLQLRDTLEYAMADPTGKWLGTGVGSIKENKLWYKENVVFPTPGVYTISIAHAMRQNGEVQGIDLLSGISDVGVEIELAD